MILLYRSLFDMLFDIAQRRLYPKSGGKCWCLCPILNARCEISFFESLLNFGLRLTVAALQDGKFDPIIGRDEEGKCLA